MLNNTLLTSIAIWMLQQTFLPGGWSFESFQDPGITPRGWRPLDETD